VRFLEEENRDAKKTLKAQREFDEFLAQEFREFPLITALFSREI
jgi:hypothetical protein